MIHRIVFALLMALVTTSVVSFTLVSFHHGFVTGFVISWLKSWTIAYITAVPILILIGPKVNVFVSRLIPSKQSNKVGDGQNFRAIDSPDQI